MLEYQATLTKSRIDGIWAFPCHVENYSLPPYGFKIHVSSTASNLSNIYSEIKGIIDNCGVHYKIISSLENLKKLNMGNFVYSQIGKAITIYPKDNYMFCELLEQLHRKTLSFQSVDIPSDYRYKNSRTIFYRYGEIARLENSPIDYRRKGIPDHIAVPFEDHYINRLDSFKDGYYPINCISTRGKSRVYLGVDTMSFNRVLIKEGLFLGETTFDGLDGSNLVIHEYEILSHLSNLASCPLIIDKFYVKSSFVLITEFISGKTLSDIILDEDDIRNLDIKISIMTKIISCLKEFEDRGVRPGDLS